MSQPPRLPFFPGLHYLRGFAALYVVLYHLHADFALPLFAYGYLGVQLFLVISGFLMTAIHHQQRGRAAAQSFARRRCIRIYPAYWVALAPVLLIFQLMPAKGFAWHRDLSNIVRNILLLHDPQTSILGVSWTLVYEMIFYAIFCLWVILWQQRLTLLLVAWSALIGANQTFHLVDANRFILVNPLNLYFILGCGLALVRRRIPGWADARLVLLTGVGFVAAPFLFRTEIAVFVTCCLLCVACISYQPRRPFPALLLLGDASYSLYLTHLTVIATVASVTRNPLTSAPLLILCVAVGILFHRWVEKPLLARWHPRPLLAPATTSP